MEEDSGHQAADETEPKEVDEPKAAEPESDAAEKHEVDRVKPKHRLARAWGWLRAKPVRLILAGSLVVLVAAGGAVGATELRYPVLGTFLRARVEVNVTDATTKQPVPGAAVSFAGVSAVTDKNGHATLTKAKLGHGQMTVRKLGYTDGSLSALAPVRQGPAISVALKPNGIKVVAQVNNGISAGSVEGVEVKSGDASALTDKTGRAELSLPPNTINTKQTLNFSRDGFNDLDLAVQVKVGGDPVAAKLIPAGKVYFQSNRTGRIDIYASNLDGSGAEVVLPGTGAEDEATGILTSISDPHTLAILSSRDGRRDGSLHHDLFVFNTDSRKLTKIDTDVDFNNYRTFIGGTLVYVKSGYTDQFSCTDIKSYEVSTGKTSTFLHGDRTAGCPTIMLATGDSFLYTVRYGSDTSRQGIYSAKLATSGKRISPSYSDNTVRRAKQTLLSEYYTNTGPTWDSIDLNGFSVTHLPNGPSVETSRYYNDSPDGTYSAFIEERDGKSELYLTDGQGGNEKKLTDMGSANQFVQWYGNDYLVFSSTKTNENALYVMGTGGGTPLKISDFYRGNQRTYGGGGNPYN